MFIHIYEYIFICKYIFNWFCVLVVQIESPIFALLQMEVYLCLTHSGSSIVFGISLLAGFLQVMKSSVDPAL